MKNTLHTKIWSE